MAYINATLVQKILYVSKRLLKSDIHHHRKADDLWTSFEIAKRGAFGNDLKLSHRPARLKSVSSDNTVCGDGCG